MGKSEGVEINLLRTMLRLSCLITYQSMKKSITLRTSKITPVNNHTATYLQFS
jgi:hypothetical protein